MEDLVAFLTLEVNGQPRSWAPATLVKNRTAICSLISWASQKGWSDPVWPMSLKELVDPKVVPVRQKHWLRAEQVRRLLCGAPEDTLHLRDRAGIYLAVFAGLRCAEIAGLRWFQLNFESDTMTLVGKGGKPAEIAIAPQLRKLLFEWKVAYETGLGREVIDEPLLCRFRHWGGGTCGPSVLTPMWGIPLGRRGLRDAVKRRAIDAGLPGVLTHDLRRTFAGILEAQGVLLQDISALLRHSTVATTQRYLADNPARRRQVMAEFEI